MRLGRWAWGPGPRRSPPPGRVPLRLGGLRGGGPGALLMDLVLDASGAFAWSPGPTTAPILSVAARRLTVESPPTVGSAPRDAQGQRRGRDTPPEDGHPDPLDLPAPA